jgi:uncharacterized membrane protein YkvA (DUF1232 family)
MRVSFDLSPRDIKYFRDRLREVREGKGARAEDAVIQLACEMIAEARAVDPPEFVLERLVKLDQLAEILRDTEWRLVGRDRARILDALAYFVDPDDLIPDKVPGIGYLDDAIMIELICQELKHDIKAYEDFCEFRKAHPKGSDEAKLEERRNSLQTRMRRRVRREIETARGRTGASKRSPFRLW